MILTKDNISGINLDDLIESKIIGEQTDKILIVVPTNRKLRDLKKKIISNFKQKPVSKIYLETLTTFSTKLLKESEYFIPLSEGAASVLIKETTDQLKLNYFNKYSKGIPFGTLDRIINVISEYKRHGISPDNMIMEANTLSLSEQQKANDLAEIYRLYSNKCKELKAFELGDIYSYLLKLPVEENIGSFNYVFPGCDQIVFDGFDEFTNLEIKVLELLSSIIDENLIISLDYHSGNRNLFSHLDNTYTNLTRNGFVRIHDLTPAELSGFKSLIRTKLFNQSEIEQNKDFRNKIYKSRAANRSEEIEEIARSIKQKLNMESVNPEKICVAFNMIANYSNLVRDIFSKYEIPFNLTDRIPLKSAPPVVAAVSLIDLLENDFYFHDLLRVLSNKFFSFPDIDLNNIIFTANNLKITRGFHNWDISVNDALNILKDQNELSEGEKRFLINSYQSALKDIEKISALLSPLKRMNTKEEFLSSFRKILVKLDLQNNVLRDSEGREEEFIKSITVFFQTLEEVLQLIDSRNIDKKYHLSFFTDHIRTISNWARFNVKEKSDYGVLVTSINEIRGLKFDHLYIGGMCDGDFPTKYSPEIFNTGTFRKKESIHQTEERFHFYQSLCCWNKELFLSIPLSDSKSDLVESTFVSDLEKIVIIEENNTSGENIISSREHLQIAFAGSPQNAKLEKAFDHWVLSPQKIKKLIQVREKRNSDPFSENIYNGFIGKNQNLKRFLDSFAEKEYSISQLETYAKCPFKYFVERILRIKTLEEPSEEIEPIELGIVLHSILFEFYSRIVKEKIPMGIEGTEEFINLKEILFNIARVKLSELKIRSPLAFFEKEKILGVEGNEKNSILYKFLVLETEQTGFEDFHPELLEYEFGNQSSENSQNLKIGNVNLRGKIDRVDVNDKNKLFSVIDYKLKGKKPSLNDLRDGLSLQLPVYLIAAKNILNKSAKNNFEAFNMIIYSLDFNKDNFGPITINLSRSRKQNLDEIIKLNGEQIKITEEAILNYYSQINNGAFNLSKLEDREGRICRFCDNKSFCRVKEVFSN